VLDGVGKPRHVFVGRLRFGNRVRSDLSRLTDLAAYFADRGDELFGRTSGRGHVAGSLI
jgi:hypothetical protein